MMIVLNNEPVVWTFFIILLQRLILGINLPTIARGSSKLFGMLGYTKVIAG